MQPKSSPDDVVDIVLAASRLLVGIADRALPETSDVTLHQFRALVVLDARGDLNVNELATLLGVSASTVTRLCDRLVRKGMIRRRHGQENRRAVSISLSPAGVGLVAKVLRRRRAAVAAIVARLDGPSQTVLAHGLTAFVQAGGERIDAVPDVGRPGLAS